MNTIDLNADIGEADTPDWAASEAAIVNAISSANIACGGHAGDAASMRLTVRNAKAAGVTIGAHLSRRPKIADGTRRSRS